jgi:hypothetical protein
VLLYLQINEKIVLGPVKLLEGHIVSKLKQKKKLQIFILVCKQNQIKFCIRLHNMSPEISVILICSIRLVAITYQEVKLQVAFVELSRKQLSNTIHY